MGFLSSIGDERWADIIGAVSLLSAAGFGLMALLTDYKKDGKITRWGRIAAAGIVTSAILAITSGIVQDRIASAASAAGQERRRIEDERFVDQINRMGELGESMSESLIAQRAMMDSQRVLLANAERSIRLTSGLAHQEQGNTLRLLERMWAEGNRIGEGSIMVAVTLRCAGAPENVVTLMPDQAVAEVTISSRQPDHPTPDQMPAGSPISLMSIDHRITRLDRSNRVIQISRFTPFLLDERFGDLQDPRRWANRSIEVDVTGLQPDLAGLLTRTSPTEIVPLSEVFERNRGLFERRAITPPRRAWIMPCEATMLFLLHGHVVGEVAGYVVLAQTHDSDASARVIIRFQLFPVRLYDIPSFNLERRPARPARAAPRAHR